MSVTGNMISQSGKAIIGMNYLDEVTGDLAQADAAVPAHLKISGNSVS